MHCRTRVTPQPAEELSQHPVTSKAAALAAANLTLGFHTVLIAGQLASFNLCAVMGRAGQQEAAVKADGRKRKYLGLMLHYVVLATIIWSAVYLKLVVSAGGNRLKFVATTNTSAGVVQNCLWQGQDSKLALSLTANNRFWSLVTLLRRCDFIKNDN